MIKGEFILHPLKGEKWKLHEPARWPGNPATLLITPNREHIILSVVIQLEEKIESQSKRYVKIVESYSVGSSVSGFSHTKSCLRSIHVVSVAF